MDVIELVVGTRMAGLNGAHSDARSRRQGANIRKGVRAGEAR